MRYQSSDLQQAAEYEWSYRKAPKRFSALVIGFPIPKDPTVCKHSLRSYLFQTEVVLGELFQLCTIRCSTLELTSRERLSRNWLSIEQPKLFEMLLRKEVIQPHLPVRLPCYDLVPITDPTFDGSLLTVRPPASGITDFRDLTGGVYKARERIHRSVADLRLLATPTSWGRVADPNPN